MNTGKQYICLVSINVFLLLDLGGDFLLLCVWYTLLLSMWTHGLVGATGGHFREICGQLDSCHVTTVNKVSAKGLNNFVKYISR